MTAVARARSTWLFGPTTDLLFGCGAIYALLLLGVGASGVTRDTLAGWLPFVLLVSGVPHYGATLLRVYGTAEARERYGRYGLWFGALVLAGFGLSLATPDFGRWFITAYLTWSPWHYTAQNFGLALMFLHRAGYDVGAPLRRLVKISFALSYAVVFAGIHGVRSYGGRDPLYADQSGYLFASLDLPDPLVRTVLVAAGLGYVAVTAVLFWHLRAQGRASRLVPVIGLALSQLAWFVAPVLVGRFRPDLFGEKGPIALAFIWVAVAHSVQYLWISLYYARASRMASPGLRSTAGYLGAATLLGAALWVVPAWLFAPGALGVLPYDAGLSLLVASGVNLHHFLLDGVIWRLRDAKVGAALMAGQGAGAPRLRASWPARLALGALGLVAVGFWSVATYEREVGYRQASLANDVERIETASRRLAVVGRDSAGIHEEIFRQRARRGENDLAAQAYQRSRELAPTPTAWPGMRAYYARAWAAMRRLFGASREPPDRVAR